VPDPSEFIDTYSDDIGYLHDARVALLTHPLRIVYDKLCNASLCRLFAIVMIGNIEAMLEHWRIKDNLKILDTYFAPNGKNSRSMHLCS